MSNFDNGIRSMTASLQRVIVLLLLAQLSPTPGYAGDALPVTVNPALAESEIHGMALSNVSGVVSVNQAAGDGNAQANSRAIAVSGEQSVALAYVVTGQSSMDNNFSMPEVAITRISDSAFQNSSGLLSVNQAGGVSNLQLNTFVLSGSINGEVSDAALAETLTDAAAVPVEGASSTSRRSAMIEGGAFVGASGVVQLNQAAGSGNLTSNRFEMSFNPNY